MILCVLKTSAASNSTVVPEFTPIAPICYGSAVPVLPSVSNNGISGTWSPSAISNTLSGSYIFIPAVGQDASAVTINVTVTPNVTPNFANQLTMQPCGTPPPLQNTSPNGITGTWSPAVISNSVSGVYTFTPDAGQCATSAAMTVDVNELNLHCDAAFSGPTMMTFDFDNVGQTSFEISYTIDGGSPNTLTQPAPSSYGVPINPGQVVTMTVTALGLSCLVSQTVTCAYLGLDDFDSQKIVFYPNPVRDFLTIEGTDGLSAIEFFNLLGQKVLTVAPREVGKTINLSKLTPGIYIANISTYSGIQTLRIIKE